jgi:hypothetical protein
VRESKIETELRKGIIALGGTCEKFVSPGTKGVPDRIVCWRADELDIYSTPTVEFIETKAPSGRLSAWQERDHVRRRALGFTVHVLWNMLQVEDYLRARGKK